MTVRPKAMSTDTVRRRDYDASLAASLHQQTLIGRILAARGVADADELGLTLDQLLRPGSMQDFDRAVDLLKDAVIEQKRILIIGDYDADGATSTALACHVLRRVGAQVSYLVPNRFEYGYGLSPAIVDVALQDKPDLIITVDNGVASNDGVKAAKDAGVSVLVTDHHLPPEQLPNADVIVNPNRADCKFPSKNLCGVGVAFYVMAGLCRRLQTDGWFKQREFAMPAMADYLDLVAVGTVADVVPLDKNNRILVEQGLRRIRAGAARPGILALFTVASRGHRRATSGDLGFVVGPRLNAAGRLDDISIGIECLLAEDMETALPIARNLDEFNRKRRQIESGMRTEGFKQVDTLIAEHEGTLPCALAVYKPEWHEGVIGIVAGRIKEKCHRPVFAFARASDGTLKGSGRSIAGVHIRDVLVAMVACEPGLLSKFGGHAMAAGVSLCEDDLPRFSSAFEAQVNRVLNGVAPMREWLTDGALDDTELNLQNAGLMKFLQPWGQEFPAPMFDDLFEIRSAQEVGTGHSRLMLRRANGSRDVPAVAFNRRLVATAGEQWRIVYRLDVNLYRERESLQLVVEHIEPA